MNKAIKVLDRDIKLIIFDMDGTLIDSTMIWHQIDKEFFQRRGYDDVPEEYGSKIVHMGLIKGAQMTIDTYGFTNDTVEGIIKEWRDASIEQYKYHIPLKDGAIEILEYYKKTGVKMAIATANEKALYQPCLDRLGIEKYFDFVADVSSVKQGKSSPEIYDSIAKRFGVTREETMVLEDSIVSLQTAFKAGYLTVAVYDISSEKLDEEKKKNSHIFINNLKELIK